MDIERSQDFDKQRFLQDQQDYMYYLMHKKEINELIQAKKTGKLMIEAQTSKPYLLVLDKHITSINILMKYWL